MKAWTKSSLSPLLLPLLLLCQLILAVYVNAEVSDVEQPGGPSAMRHVRQAEEMPSTETPSTNTSVVEDDSGDTEDAAAGGGPTTMKTVGNRGSFPPGTMWRAAMLADAKLTMTAECSAEFAVAMVDNITLQADVWQPNMTFALSLGNSPVFKWNISNSETKVCSMDFSNCDVPLETTCFCKEVQPGQMYTVSLMMPAQMPLNKGTIRVEWVAENNADLPSLSLEQPVGEIRESCASSPKSPANKGKLKNAACGLEAPLGYTLVLLFTILACHQQRLL